MRSVLYSPMQTRVSAVPTDRATEGSIEIISFTSGLAGLKKMLVIASPSLLVLSSALKFISELSSILTIRTAFSESSDEKSYRFMQIPVFTHESPAGVYPGSSLLQAVSDRRAAVARNE